MAFSTYREGEGPTVRKTRLAPAPRNGHSLNTGVDRFPLADNEGMTDPRNALNDLTAKEWIVETVSPTSVDSFGSSLSGVKWCWTHSSE